MVFYANTPVGTGYCNPHRYSGYSLNPFNRGWGCGRSSYWTSSYRPCFPRPWFPSFSYSSFYDPCHYRVTSFHSLNDRAFSLGSALTLLAIGILLCAIL